MRCIIGLTLFLVLYFGSCKVLYEISSAMAGTNGPGHSLRADHGAGLKVVKKYHALVAVGAGAVALLGCSLPTLLAKRIEQDVWRHWDGDVEHG